MKPDDRITQTRFEDDQAVTAETAPRAEIMKARGCKRPEEEVFLRPEALSIEAL